jgi:hypothetical protein
MITQTLFVVLNAFRPASHLRHSAMQFCPNFLRLGVLTTITWRRHVLHLHGGVGDRVHRLGLRPSLSYPNLLVRDDVWKRTKLSHRSLRQPYTDHRLWNFNPNWILIHSEYIMHTPYAGLSVICGDGWTVVGRWSSTLPRFNVLLAPALITDWKLRTPRDPIWKCITTGCDSSR